MFIPSTENVNVMLPSNVTSGCKYIRKVDTRLILLERKRENELALYLVGITWRVSSSQGNLRFRRDLVTCKSVFWSESSNPDGDVLLKFKVRCL